MSEENPSAAGRFAAGSQIAGYRLEEQIGLGGMAVVFRAHDDRLDRMVALKILAPGLALDDAFRQRFIRESRAAAAVDDPHIIPVFEAGEASGVLFIAMRYVRGGDVRTLLDQIGPLPPARATEIISQVASALDAAHARGLVHRDVKPANMLLDASAGTDRPDHVYLSDFGLSKQSLAPSGLTSTGQFLGTLDYVAPEQIEGRPVDGRTDEYALACAAFELLSGAPPFRRDEGLAVVYAQLSEPPPSLAARRSGLPPAIDPVLTRALAKSPADRYPSCRDFAVALREVFGLRPVDSGPSDSPPPRAATEIAMPVAPSRGAGDEQARPAENQAPPQSPQPQSPQPQSPQPHPTPAAGPATEAAGFPVTRPTRPGLTAPPAPGSPGWAEPPDEPRSGRSRWRTPAALAAACAVVVIIGGGAVLALHHGSGDGGSGSGGGSGAGQGAAASLAVPACTTAVAKAAPLSKVRSASVQLTGDPFGAAVTADGRYSFVTLGNSIAMLRKGSGLAPTLVRTIPAAGADKGDVVTPDGRYLLAADNSGIIVISIAEAKQGFTNPVVATLTSPHGSGAVGVTTSPDGRFAFVTLQTSDNLAVFNLARALAHGFTRADFVGYVPFDKEPDGITISPDGKWLYVTSIDPGNSNDPGQGTLSVLSRSRAEVTPATAVVAKTAAGCQPARVITSPNGSVVWVTARQSDSLLGFSATKLRSAPAHSLIAKVAVGPNPIGLSLVRGGSRIVVADSDLSALPGASPSVAVVNTSAALAGKPALLGLVRSGMVPRQFALEPNGKTLLVTNQNSHQLQALHVADLP